MSQPNSQEYEVLDWIFVLGKRRAPGTTIWATPEQIQGVEHLLKLKAVEPPPPPDPPDPPPVTETRKPTRTRRKPKDDDEDEADD